MTKAEERRTLLKQQSTSTNTNTNTVVSKAQERRKMLSDAQLSPTQTSATTKQNAFNILNNATSSQNYDSLVQTKENTNNSAVTLKGPMQALDAIKGGNKFERTLAERQNKRNAGLMVEEAPLFTPIGLAEAGSNPIELVEAHRQAEKELSNINQAQKEAGNYEKYMGNEYSKLGEHQNKLADSIRGTDINQMARDMVALKNAEAGKEVQDLSKYYDSGATQANYILGNLNIRYNEAMAKYLKTQNLSDLNEAERIKELITLYNENAQNVGKGGLIRKDFASYAPQLVGQTVSGVKGALAGAGAGALTGAGIGSVVPGAGTAAGASTGALWGARGGYVAGVGAFSYDQMKGSAYAQLLDLGIPDDIAKEVASDTALWQSVVEMTGAVVDLASLGLGSKAVKGAAGKTVGQLTAKQLITNALKAYGINLVEETAEESIQEKIAIEQEKKAFEKAGLERTTTEKEDQERIVEAGAGGFKIALVSGSGNVIGNITATTINNSTISKVNKTYDEQINKIKTSNLSEEQKQEQINTLETGRKKTVDAIKNAMTETEGKKIIKINNLQENVTPQSPNTQIQQQTNEVIPQQTENQQNANVAQNNANVQNVAQNDAKMQQSLGINQENTQVPTEIQTFIETRNKTAPGLKVEMDSTLNTDGVIIKNADGTRTIKINPNSTRKYEFVAVHEMLHDLENTPEFKELSEFVKQRAITHENFEKAKQAITEQYQKYYQENNLDMSGLNMEIETTNDMVAQALGNPQFLNELAGQKPNVFMRLYNWIKNVAFDGRNTGKTFAERNADNKYLQELKKKFETAYNTAYKGNSGQQFDIITTADNKRYAKATRQVIKGNDASKWGEQVEKYINEEIRKGQDVSFYGADGELLTITRDTAGKAKFRNEVTMADGTKRKLTDDEYKAKLEAETHIDELAQISKHKNGPVPDTKNHSFAKDGFNYRTAYFEDSDGKYYKITMSVGKNGEINTIYNVGQMKDAQKNRSNTSNRGLEGPSDKIASGSITSNNSITSQSKTVKNSTQSSFSLGENTLPKVQKGYTRLYRGLTQEYDANYDRNKIDNSNRYESWTDNYELAKAYGDNVYYIDVPTSVIKDSIIDEDDKSETYGDRNLIYRNDKPVGIKGKNGNEYMLYTDHDDFTNIQYNKVPTLTDIQEKNYSQSNNEWQKYLDKNWDLMPNATKTFGLPSVEQLQARDLKQGEEISNTLNMKKPKLEDIANLTEKEAQLPTMTYKQRADKNTPYRRKFWDNVESSKIVSKDVKEQVNMTNYERKHNNDVLEKMKERLDTEPMKVAREWFNKDIKKATEQDVALGAILLERYQAEGRIEEAVDVVEKLADMGTEAGRTVQMYSIFQRLTPEGMMMYQQRKLNSALETLTAKQTGKWVEQNKDKFKLTEDDATFITAKVQEAQYAPTERQKQIALAEIESRINDKLPPEAGQSVKAFRRIAMLFNPKTQVRNVAGNVTVMPLNFVSDLVGTAIDKAIAKRTGVRTTALPNVKTIGKGFVKGASETIDDYRRGIRTTPTGSRYEIQNNAKSFNENTNSRVKNAINNKLNAIDRILSTTLELGDRPFYEAAYQNALEAQMKANNVTEPTQDMIDIASNVALSQTWQDNNNYTQAVLGIRSAFNKININGFGLGDLIIPFAKTPANLTKAMVDYSPLGFIPALINYNNMNKAMSRGDMTAMQQKKFVDSVGKAVAGTLLYALAYGLVQNGAVTGSADEDKDVANFEKNVLGIQPYSIKIGDKTFTYNWAQPLATPFAIMADAKKMSAEDSSFGEILVNAFKVAGDQLVANSFLQGIQELLSSEYGNESAMDNLVNAIMDLPTQFTPTLLGQIATQFDATKRQTFENGDTVGTMLNEVKNKIPGAKNTLAPQVNTFGEEIQNYGGDNNPFNVFLNPANISSANASDTQKELYTLYEVTKDKTIFPRQAPYSVEGGGEKVTLSSQDRATFQKTSGQYVTENLGALFDSNFYKTLDNDKKVEVVAKIVTDANTTARDIWIDTEATKDLSELKNDLKESNIPLIDYYNAWIAQKDEEGEKNILTGKTKTGNKKQARIKAIDEAVGDNLNTWQINKLYDILN